MPKVHNKPIKRPEKDSNIESKSQPKCALVWRTGQCSVHQGLQLRTAHLREFWRPLRYNSPDCPVKHRTMSGDAPDCPVGPQSNGYFAPTVVCNRIKCATVRTEVRHAPEGAPDSLHDLSGAPPDCPVAQKTEAPTVRIQRLGDVAGAPDCPVRHATAAFTKRLVWWLGL